MQELSPPYVGWDSTAPRKIARRRRGALSQLIRGVEWLVRRSFLQDEEKKALYL
jgi:hypothetical protein